MNEINKIEIHLKQIIEADELSLLANGAEEMLRDILEFSNYKLDLEDIKEMLEDLFQDTKDSEVKELIKTLLEKKDTLEEFRKEKIKERGRIRNNREKIDKARQELQLQNARPVTNKYLEGKTIMIKTTKTINDELMAFFYLKGKEEKKLRFKPSYFQRQKLFSWGMGPEEWPLEVRAVRTVCSY